MNRKELGDQAEVAAAKFLESRGFQIIERNFRSRAGEIDLIARDGETLVFVEVRSRQSSAYGFAAETIGPQKRRRVIQTARLYLHSRGLDDRASRFDVVAFDGGVCEHIAGAFTSDEG